MPEKYNSEEAKVLKIGLYTALCLCLAVLLFYTHKSYSNKSENGKSYEINARFGRTDGLLVGDNVRLAGVNIGKVVNAQLDDNFHAILTLDIKDGILIPDDSSASIVSSGIMGNKYIEIEPGGSFDYLAPGSEFAYTQDAMVLEELIDRIIGIGKANRKNDK